MRRAARASAKRRDAKAAEGARAAVLDAAEAVVNRRGIGALTLDAVAAQAGLSKSGLLHHYRSKDALIGAMVRRRVEEWRAQYTAAIDRQPHGPGRVPRAFLSMCLSSAERWTRPQQSGCRVLVAALVHSPAAIAPLREVQDDLSDRLAHDGLPLGVGETVLLAVDGLWFDWLLGIAEPSAAKLARVRAVLEGLIETAGARAGRAPGARGGQRQRGVHA